MQIQDNVIDCYNKTAIKYADTFMDELSKKHLDGILLKAFALENAGKGKLIDLGCGPGQTTRYLADCGIVNITGTDISPEMVRVAKTISPQIDFEIADILNLKYTDNYFRSAVAFYSIVHFNYDQLIAAFNEIKRVLAKQGQFLFSFHVGDTIIHVDSFLEQQVNIDFYFFEVEKIIGLLKETGFEIVDIIQRHPYTGIEYASKRAYVWVQNP